MDGIVPDTNIKEVNSITKFYHLVKNIGQKFHTEHYYVQICLMINAGIE